MPRETRREVTYCITGVERITFTNIITVAVAVAVAVRAVGLEFCKRPVLVYGKRCG
jgi:hypothetical protein